MLGAVAPAYPAPMPNTQELPIFVGEGEALANAARPQLHLDHKNLRSLTVDGRRIAYQDTGSGPVVILAHCSGGSHREWASLVPELSTRYRVIVPDLLGYGASEPWPANAPLNP